MSELPSSFRPSIASRSRFSISSLESEPPPGAGTTTIRGCGLFPSPVPGDRRSSGAPASTCFRICSVQAF